MKVTLDHPESKHGYPVILNDTGDLMEVAEGIAEAIRRSDCTYEQFAAYCNIKPATLRQYGRRAIAPANVLNMLGILLESPDAIRRHVSADALKLTADEQRVLKDLRDCKTYAQIAKSMKVTRQRAFEIASAARGKRKKGGV
jgi:DNA-binding NarL/FixJ family response regulator